MFKKTVRNKKYKISGRSRGGIINMIGAEYKLKDCVVEDYSCRGKPNMRRVGGIKFVCFF